MSCPDTQNCRLKVTLKQLHLTSATAALTIASEIFRELEEAKRKLKL